MTVGTACRYSVSMSSETANVILKGHAYRPTRNPYGRNVIPGCECGAHIAWAGAVNTTTARHIHREHKRAIIRERGAK